MTFPYIVHVERKDLTDWGINVTPPNGQRVQVHSFYNRFNVKVEGCLDEVEGNYSLMETWYCVDLVSSQGLAAKLANEKPGSNINIYLLNSVYRSAPGPVSISNYTEQGLLPA